MRYELTDCEGAAIKPFLPNKPRGVPRVNDRSVLNGIFWVLRSGAPWRDLPESEAGVRQFRKGQLDAAPEHLQAEDQRERQARGEIAADRRAAEHKEGEGDDRREE